MMSGLMMVFLLIAVAYMLMVEQTIKQETETAHQKKSEAEEREKTLAQQNSLLEEREKALARQNSLLLSKDEFIQEIVLKYDEGEELLHDCLYNEFKDDLPRWNASLERDNTIRFNEPEVLFESGRADLRTKFQDILNQFFPRYIAILTKNEFRDRIDEVRVEGHTSSDWRFSVSDELRYLNNAQLSQARALSVVQYVYQLNDVSTARDWLRTTLRSNGLSFAKPVYDLEGREDADRSRRVEFRVLTKAKEELMRIIGKYKSDQAATGE